MGRPRNQAKWDEVVKYQLRGFSNVEIGRLVDLHYTTVHYILRRLKNPGLPSANPNRIRRGPTVLIMAKCKRNREEWRELYERGRWTIPEIADAYGKSFSAVQRGLKALGVKSRSSKESGIRSEVKRRAIAIQIDRHRVVAAQPQHQKKNMRIARMMDLSLRIERRGRRMLA